MARGYKLTTVSCFVGCFVQAVITNLTAVLFVPLMDSYSLSYVDLGILASVNFGVQVAADLMCSVLVDRLGFRRLALPCCLLSFTGIMLFGLTPYIFAGTFFTGAVISTVIFAVSGGMLEVLLSPIVDAIPADDKGSAMSLLHSFYAWGQMACIIIVTLYIYFAGGARWNYIVLALAFVPLVNFIMFLLSPFPPTRASGENKSAEPVKRVFFNSFFIFALCAIFMGSCTEVVMNQWASSFMEKGLSLPKITGDMLGMCGFAAMLGTGRALHGKFGAKADMNRLLLGGAIISILCYIVASMSPFTWLSVAACALTGFSASLLWPGTLTVTSVRFPMAGAWIFAALAVAGDLGASFGPWLCGKLTDSLMSTSAAETLARVFSISAEQSSIRLAILVCVAFPLAAAVCHYILLKKNRRMKKLSGEEMPE